MRREWFVRVFLAVQLVGAICSVLTLTQGVRILVVDFSDWRGFAWLAGFGCLLIVVLFTRSRGSPTITQRGTETGTNHLRNQCVFYPIPLRTPPHLIVHKVRFNRPYAPAGERDPGVGSEPSYSEEYEIVGQTGGSFTITSKSTATPWSFKWKATGIPDYRGSSSSSDKEHS